MSAQAANVIESPPTNAISRIPVSDLETLAVSIVKSGLFGIKNVHQAIALMAIAEAEGIHPATAARDYHIIQGRPAMKADAMLARFHAKGGITEVLHYGDDGVTMKFSHPSGGTATIAWDAKRAVAAKIGNRDTFKSFAAAMFRARCISEGIRTVFPGVIVGVYSPEEAEEFKPVKLTKDSTADDGSAVEPQAEPEAIDAECTPVVSVAASETIPAEPKKQEPQASQPPPPADVLPVTIEQLRSMKDFKEKLAIPDDQWKAAMAKRRVASAKELSFKQADEVLGKLSARWSEIAAKQTNVAVQDELGQWVDHAVSRNLASGQVPPGE